jgi:hypothetical protein
MVFSREKPFLGVDEELLEMQGASTRGFVKSENSYPIFFN